MKGSGRSMLAALAMAGLAGCSDQSRMRLYIDSITSSSSSGGSSSQGYVNADIMGGSGPCTPVSADLVNVAVRMDRPGTIGPNLDVFVTGYGIEYFYYDPADGRLKGPEASLTVPNAGNMRIVLGTTSPLTPGETIPIPLVPVRLKIWSVGVTCSGVAGFTGVNRVNRMIAQITIYAEDGSGAKTSAKGSVIIYLEDYAPSPDPVPAGSTPTAANFCYGMAYQTYWGLYCN